MVEKIPGWLERLLLPRLSSLEGELRAFRGEAAGEFKALHIEVKALDERMRTEIGRLDERFNSLEKRMDLVEQIAVL